MTDFKHDEVRTSRRVTRYYLEGVMVAKDCNGCSRTLPPEAFSKRALNKTDGLQPRCNDCMVGLRSEWYRADPSRSFAQNAWNRRNPGVGHAMQRERNYARTEGELDRDMRKVFPDGVKGCRKCRRTLPLEKFHRDRAKLGTLTSDCKACFYKKGVERRTKENIEYWSSIGIDPTFCFYCEFPIYGGDELHADHVIPLFNGGPDEQNNLVPTCRSCNLCKRDKSLLQFLHTDFPYEEDQERILSKLRSFGIDWTLPRREGAI